MSAHDRWHILDRAGESLDPKTLPPRPPDARHDQGDPFTPWHKQDEHLHVESGRIDGIHARGSLEAVRERLLGCLKYERFLLEATGGREDILLADADRIIAERG